MRAGDLVAMGTAAAPPEDSTAESGAVMERTGDLVATGIAAGIAAGSADTACAGGEGRALRFDGARGAGETGATTSGESKTEVSEPDDTMICCGSGDGDTGPGLVSMLTSLGAGVSSMIEETAAAQSEHCSGRAAQSRHRRMDIGPGLVSTFTRRGAGGVFAVFAVKVGTGWIDKQRVRQSANALVLESQ